MSNTIKGGNWIAAITGGVFQLVRTLVRSDVLLKSPASVLAAYLIANSIGSMTTPTDNNNWPLYVSHMPDGRNVKTDCGTLYDTTGLKDGRAMSGRVIQHYGVQLRVRSRVYETGWAKVEDIASILDSVHDAAVTSVGVSYELKNISRTSPVIALGSEIGTTKRRFLFTMNFLITMKKLT